MAKALDAESLRVSDVNPVSVATLSTVVATNTITVNGVTLTGVDADPTTAQFLVGASDAATATNIVASLIANAGAAYHGVLVATASGATIRFEAVNTTRTGIALSGTNTFTFTHAVIASRVADDFALRVARRTSTIYANTGLGATTAVNTGELDLTGVEECVVVIFNGNTTQTRTPSFLLKDEAGTTMHTITASAITANTTVIYSFGRGATATGVTAGYAITLPPKFQVTTGAPASGTGGGKVYVWVR
jgi:hypothetical protein